MKKITMFHIEECRYCDFAKKAIAELREAKPNPRAKLKNKLSMLWKSEFSHILAGNKMPKYDQKSKKFIAEKLLEKVPEESLHVQISDELFERDYTIYD